MTCPPANLKIEEPRVPGIDTCWDWADRLPRLGVESAQPGPTVEIDPRVSPGELRQGFVRPLRLSAKHLNHVASQTFALPIGEALAREPGCYGALWCITCNTARPVSEWHWMRDNQTVGT